MKYDKMQLLILLLIFGVGAWLMTGSLIKKMEGLSLVPYQDSAGNWTIGYGHKIIAGDPYYPKGDIKSITEAQANDLLVRDLVPVNGAISSYVTVPLTTTQKEALQSFIFNVGVTAFAHSTLLSKLNAGDTLGAATEFSKWVYANNVIVPGLVARREAEQTLFLV